MTFQDVCDSFLGNTKSINHKALIKKLVKSYELIKAKISVKLHFLICHLEKFPINCGHFSDEMGEQFHQLFKIFQNRFKSDLSKINMLAAYHFSLLKKENIPDCKRKLMYKTFN